MARAAGGRAVHAPAGLHGDHAAGPRAMRVFDLSAAGFGALVSAYTLASAAMGLLGVFWLDRFERKRTLLALYGGFILSTLWCGLAGGPVWLGAARTLAGACAGLMGAVIMALVADQVPVERRGPGDWHGDVRPGPERGGGRAAGVEPRGCLGMARALRALERARHGGVAGPGALAAPGRASPERRTRGPRAPGARVPLDVWVGVGVGADVQRGVLQLPAHSVSGHLHDGQPGPAPRGPALGVPVRRRGHARGRAVDGAPGGPPWPGPGAGVSVRWAPWGPTCSSPT